MAGIIRTTMIVPWFKFPAAQPKVLFTTVPPASDDESADRGLIIIKGGQAKVIRLNHSYSANASRSVKKETKRVVDIVRIKNPANPDQHVDVQRPVKITTSPTQTNIRAGGAEITIYAKQPAADNIEVLQEGVEIKNPEA